ncbi:MAG: hypothetical protein HQL36_08250, partial [Alphaproteobacteria bacterium]|nr:hypothetical protein [Alphaproteobacteria bacterium]
MHRVDNGTAAAARPASTAPGPNPDGFFTDGNPAGGVPATTVDAEWLNMAQEELASVIIAAGLTPDKSDNTQLSQAITSMIQSGSHAVVINSAVFNAAVADGDVVRWSGAEFVEALADGTASNRAVGVADVTNGKVIAFGETSAGLFAGLTPGARYYLDGSTAGAIADTAPTDGIYIGIAKS